MIDIHTSRVRLGSDYGGWEIVPGLLTQDSIIYSAGVGEDISFDLQLIDATGARVHAFDPTPRSINWVRSQNISDDFVLHEYGLSDIDGVAAFHPPLNPNHISHSVVPYSGLRMEGLSFPVKRILTIMRSLGHNEIDLLKMDIEGSEYQVLNDMLEQHIYPRQLLVEFHHRFNSIGVSKTLDMIRNLRKSKYQLFSISDSGEECGFLLQNEM